MLCETIVKRQEPINASFNSFVNFVGEYNPDAPSMEPRLWVKQPFRTTGKVPLLI